MVALGGGIVTTAGCFSLQLSGLSASSAFAPSERATPRWSTAIWAGNHFRQSVFVAYSFLYEERL
jgi:hypothetical protein